MMQFPRYLNWVFLISILAFAYVIIYCLFNELNLRLDSKLTFEYDYVIVGCGSAGSVVARRLAQNKKDKILILEAGPHIPSLFNIASLGVLFQKTYLDWRYQTVPQKNACKAFKNDSCAWPMGKLVGGSHMLNNLIYTRGHPNDYDEWFRDLKDYSYEKDILPYFERAENIERTKNNKGSIFLADISYFSDLADNILEAIKIMGFTIRNSTQVFTHGFFKPKVTQKNGQRWTTASHLLSLDYPNLLLQTNAFVEEVLFEGDFEAKGVKFHHGQNTYVVRTTKGVILSAGVVGTPKILMLSGIGPKEHLDSLTIRTKLDLPVGENLQDHIATGLDLVTLNSSVNLDFFNMISPYSAYQYFVNGAGPWTTVGCEVVGFLDENLEKCWKKSVKNCDTSTTSRPKLEIMVLPIGVTFDGGLRLRTLVGLKDDVWKNHFSKIRDTGITILPVLLHPQSTGTIKLRDKNYQSAPVIDPNYLSNSTDHLTLIDGIQFLKKLISTKPLLELGAKLNKNSLPGCEDFEFDSEGYWRCYVSHLTFTSYHPIGTSKMGLKSKGGVVDFNFQVHGTNKLFVVDASTFPSQVSGNINAAVIMMAEKASEAIKYFSYLSEMHTAVSEILVPKVRC